LARLFARRPDGIFVTPFETGEIGPDLFRAACNMGLEGMVSKRSDRPCRAGRSKDWIKVKNRRHPAMERAIDQSGPSQPGKRVSVDAGERWYRIPQKRLTGTGLSLAKDPN
jgi:hypothetical protein